MNIQEAKEQIRQTVTIYLEKNAHGRYRIPPERQRPIFMIGSPGIGKTAIMEQIASELGIGLVSYSMTHHTRQSALGLPVIRTASYAGKTFEITEYTMSEIIAAVYKSMEESGRTQGILFLDEINCVSETLAPAMLQFLQYKTFGTHRVPDGWVIVTAGNPPQFNRSVREFDVAMMDRLKILEVEPDYTVWRTYAVNADVHPAILNYLDIRKDDFYRIENTVDGKTYCTARGWEDLSDAMRLYEENGYKVDDSLVLQYIRNKKIAHEFATYYDLYRKYRGDYETAAILNGTESAEVRRRAGRAAFDERVTLLSLLTDSVLGEIRASVREETALRSALPIFRDIKKEVAGGTKRPVVDSLKARREALEEAMARDKKSGALSSVQERSTLDLEDILEKAETQLRIQGLTQSSDGEAAFAWIRENFGARAAAMKDGADTAEKHLDNLFEFVNSAFGSGNEMLLLTTHLSVSRDAVKFLSGHRCDAYYKYAKKYEIYNREEELDRELDAIDIDSLGD